VNPLKSALQVKFPSIRLYLILLCSSSTNFFFFFKVNDVEKFLRANEHLKNANSLLSQNDIDFKNKDVVALWKLGELEIEGIVRGVCEVVLSTKETGISLHEKKNRIRAIRQMGKIYTQIAKGTL